MITKKQRMELRNNYFISDIHYMWCRRMADAETHTEQQIITINQLLNMYMKEQNKHIIIDDVLVKSRTKERFYLLDRHGDWVYKTSGTGKYHKVHK